MQRKLQEVKRPLLTSKMKAIIFIIGAVMYFLLFLIGFKVDILKIKKLGKFIVKSTFFIIFFEALFGSFLVHFLFGLDRKKIK